MRVFARFVRAYPRESVWIVVGMVAGGVVEGLSLTALIPAVIALFSGDGFGHALPNANGPGRFVMQTLQSLGITPSLGPLLAAFTAGNVVKSLVSLVVNRNVGYSVAQVASNLRLELLRALLSARWEYFLRQPLGKLANAVSWEADRASGTYYHGATMVAAAVQLVAYASVAMLMSWRATLLYLGVAGAVLWGLHRLVRMARRAGKRQARIRTSLLAQMTDSLMSVKPLKAMGREDQADAVLTTRNSDLNRAVQLEVLSKEGLKAVQDPVFAVLVVSACYFGVTYSGLAPAALLVMIMLLTRILGTMGKMQSQYQGLVSCKSGYWAVQRTIDEATAELEVNASAPPPHLEKGIRLEGVEFAYERVPVLSDVSLWIPAGSFTTLVGFSGAGKTTIVDLVIGLLRPQEGRVWIDDQPLDELDRHAWRRMIGYVPQENLLLHDSVLRNVTLGDARLTEADAERALRAADAWDFVCAMTGGIHASVGERGGRLSGGQRQRIMIARALVHRPRLLVLDEATSALDPVSARSLAQTLKALRGRMTVLAISHQPDLVEAAHRVYRMEKGRAILVEDRGLDRPASREAASGA
jgi:ATP-binding cassette, subfamily C, bacterial